MQLKVEKRTRTIYRKAIQAGIIPRGTSESLYNDIVRDFHTNIFNLSLTRFFGVKTPITRGTFKAVVRKSDKKRKSKKYKFIKGDQYTLQYSLRSYHLNSLRMNKKKIEALAIQERGRANLFRIS